jgi:hypothetical protein
VKALTQIDRTKSNLPNPTQTKTQSCPPHSKNTANSTDAANVSLPSLFKFQRTKASVNLLPTLYGLSG